MNRDDSVNMLIDRLIDVRRAINSKDREQELKDQEQTLITKLEAMGITVSNLPNPK